MPPTEDDAPRWPEWLETWVFPYMWEPILWPVWISILGHVVLIFAHGVLSVSRGGSWFTFVVSAALTVGLAGWELRLFRRPGPVFLSLFGTWAVAIVVIVIAVRTGFI